LLANVSQSGQESGLNFLLFVPKPNKTYDFYAEIPVSIEVNGGYHNLALFFDRVARLSRIVNIENIDIADSGKEPGMLEMKCTAVTYQFLESTE
jgi:type IV pilus assembly protein PilO